MPLYRHIKTGIVSDMSERSFDILNESTKVPTYEKLTQSEIQELATPTYTKQEIEAIDKAPVRIVDVTQEASKQEVKQEPTQEAPKQEVKQEPKPKAPKAVSAKDLD